MQNIWYSLRDFEVQLWIRSFNDLVQLVTLSAFVFQKIGKKQSDSFFERLYKLPFGRIFITNQLKDQKF